MLSSDQQQSSASCPPPLPRLILFLLVDSETGEPYKGASIDAVLLSPDALIIQFRKLVHRENSAILSGIAPSQLLVYKNKAAFDRRNNAEDEGKEQPLDPTESIGMLGSKEDMLVVVVPDLSLIKEPSRESKRAKQSAFWYFLTDSETGEPYKGAGIDAVSLSPDANIIQFRDALHAKNSNTFAGIDPFNLLVYKNKAAFDRRNNAADEGKEQPLKASQNLDGLGESEEEALVVIVPPPSQPPYLHATQTQSFPPCQHSFFNGIQTIRERDGWISFGQEEIPSTSLKSLYIRECYKIIASRILQVSGKHKAIISGTPGVGKSLFLLYLLWRLVKEGKRVFFIYGTFNIYCDENGGVFSLDKGCMPSWRDISFWNDSLWCLFDAKFKNESDLIHLPMELCTFIVSTSPRREMVNDFRKPPVPQVFFMPTWTEDELEAIAPLFPEAKEEWHDRFDNLGGIPRHVLEDTTRTPTEILDAACKNCSLEDCITEIGVNSTITEKSKAIHYLIHITSSPPFTESSMKYASRTAMDSIVEFNQRKDKHKIHGLLASCEGSHLTATLCGHIFEVHAIKLLEEGGDFPCRQLVGGRTKTQSTETTLTIPPSAKIFVDKVLREQTETRLHVPRRKNYPGIDAWIPGIGAFQMTISQKHNIHKRVKDDLAMLGTQSRFYFVLPPSNYDSFTKQTYQEMDQYAILIPYPE